jgi:hypothetical protein
MLILGSSGDDKGTQLEVLTQTLLTKMGYENVTTNFIAPGGAEIDVRAEYTVPGLSGNQVHQLICECKAHNTTINITDWFKFLGKVFTEEARLNQTISGCLIALSGANGNVTGSYDELKNHRNTITLVVGQRLSELLAEIYEICSLDQISNSVQRFTKRHFLELEIAYYNRNAYWVVTFEEEAYTILTAKGEPYTGAQLETLKNLLNSAISAKTFVDLNGEAEAQRRRMFTQKMVLTQIMVDDGSTDFASLVNGNFSFVALTERDWISRNADQVKISFSPDNHDDFYSWIIDIYRFLLKDTIIANVLGSSYYDNHINEHLVDKIRVIQGNLPLSPEDIPEIILLLRWSPNALARALDPDPMIVTHRKEGTQPENVDRNDRIYFLRQLYEALAIDFRKTALKHYFYQTRGIRELETLQKVVVKNENEIVAQNESRERRAIGRLFDEMGGG